MPQRVIQRFLKDVIACLTAGRAPGVAQRSASL